MSGIFSLLKTWNENETLTSEDLNNAFLNQKTNFVSPAVEGYSTVNNVPNLDRALATLDPAPNGDPLASLGNSSVAGEIQKIRYQINQIIGGANWTSVPFTSLANLTNALVSYVSSLGSQETAFFGGMQPAISEPVSDGRPYINKNAISNGQITFTNRIPLKLSDRKRISFAFYFKQSVANINTIAVMPGIGLSISVDSNAKVVLSFFSFEATSNVLKKTYTVTSTNSYSPLDYTHVAVEIDWSGAAGSHSVKLWIDGELASGSLSGQTIILPTVTNDWLILDTVFSYAQSNLLAFNSADETTWPAGWTKVGAGGTVTNGILTMTAGAASNYYEYTGSALNSAEFMCRVQYCDITGNSSERSNAFYLYLGLNSENRSFRITLSDSGLTVLDNDETGLDRMYKIRCDLTQWTRVGFILSASDLKIYINGMCSTTITLTGNYVAALDVFQFGHELILGSAAGTLEVAYIANNIYRPSYDPTFGCSVKELYLGRSSFGENGAVVQSLLANPAEDVFSVKNSGSSPVIGYPVVRNLDVLSVTADTSYEIFRGLMSDGIRPIFVQYAIEATPVAGTNTTLIAKMVAKRVTSGLVTAGEISGGAITTALGPSFKVSGDNIAVPINLVASFPLAAGVWSIYMVYEIGGTGGPEVELDMDQENMSAWYGYSS